MATMTVLLMIGQAVSLWLMWRYHHERTGPKTGRNNRTETEPFAHSS